jgi:hypothetical protein
MEIVNASYKKKRFTRRKQSFGEGVLESFMNHRYNKKRQHGQFLKLLSTGKIDVLKLLPMREEDKYEIHEDAGNWK